MLNFTNIQLALEALKIPISLWKFHKIIYLAYFDNFDNVSMCSVMKYYNHGHPKFSWIKEEKYNFRKEFNPMPLHFDTDKII